MTLPVWRIAAPPMVAVVALLLAVSSHHGPHWDELYFAQLPLQWWYVDQPPLTVWLTWLMGQLSGALWVQRLPAIAAAAAGAWVAALFPRALGASARVQSLAAWAHAFTVYPLIMGHVFTTSTLDLLAWQVVVLFVLYACQGWGASWLGWAGLVAGVACWNKLLIVALVGALAASLLITARRLLWTRGALVGAVAFVAFAAPQVGAQVIHGLPMTEVSAGLVDQQGTLVRLVLVPAIALFAGPPLLLIWLAGLVDPWRSGDRAGRFLLPTFLLVVGFNLVSPSQPYYAVGALLPALALGWASPTVTARWSLPTLRRLAAANGAVSVLVCLPLLPADGPWGWAQAQLNPTIRDQLGWPDYARQVTDQLRPGEAVVTDLYALAGAVHRYGPPEVRDAVFSGHNALWSLGPPNREAVLLVGRDAVAQAGAFERCTPAQALQPAAVAHPQLRDVPVMHCVGPSPDWASVWPALRRLSG
ncbi:MAG: glycosyltransferase family 39 protein [Propionibacteriaceae bacterium]|nr:glycosyltransferase family 39 protein [Propionibacteriaceae bacterium]